LTEVSHGEKIRPNQGFLRAMERTGGPEHFFREVITFMPEPFSIQSERHGRTHRLTPFGELDIATTPILRDAFEIAFEDGDAEMIVLDLTKLDFMDSSGVLLLLGMQAACEDADRLRIVNGSPAVVRIVDLSGVRRLLPIISRTDDPLAPLPPQP
jgi:anti-anti-sigma factor